MFADINHWCMATILNGGHHLKSWENQTSYNEKQTSPKINCQLNHDCLAHNLDVGGALTWKYMTTHLKIFLFAKKQL